MIKLSTDITIKKFEYFYIWVMVIYMARISPETSRMIGGFGFDIPFLFPIILTLVLLHRNKISFQNNNLKKLLGLFMLWTMVIILKFSDSFISNPSQVSYSFFLFYSILIAYIHIKVFGKKLFVVYEDIIVKLAIISLPLWALGQLIPVIPNTIYSLFPDNGFGYNILYLFNWIHNEEHTYRNSGCSWEPGMFASLILFAIAVNILRNKSFRLKHNNNIFILFLALLSTFSTTGYVTFLLLVLYVNFKNKLSNVILIISLIPIVIFIFQLDFMSQKIMDQLNLDEANENFMISADYAFKTMEKGEYTSSLGRFQTIYFEFENFKEDFLIGYGLSSENSYFYNNISTNYSLPGGIMTLLSRFGLFFGLYIYYLFYRSSNKLSKDFSFKKNNLFFITYLLSSVSYNLFISPIIMSYFLYDAFSDKKQLTN